MLDLRRLRLLSEISRRRTIADVAEAVGETPWDVSETLGELERELGFALLEQDGPRVRLTPAAQGLVARADKLLDELDTAEAELAAEEGSVKGDLSIGGLPDALTGIVEPVARELSERHPELKCTAREHRPEDGIPLLRSGKLDVLVYESYDEGDSPPGAGLERHPLMREPLLLVLPTGHPAGETVELHTLSDASWIAGSEGTPFAAALEQTCRAAGFEPRIAHRADDAVLQATLAAAGMGIGLLPALACEERHGVRFARIAPHAPHRHLSALLGRPAETRPALMVALEALRRRGSILSAEGQAERTVRPAAT